MTRHPFLLPENWLLAVVDLQEKLLKAMPSHRLPRLEKAVSNLIYLAKLYKKPIVVTEQYPKGLGKTVASLEKELREANFERIEKVEFSAYQKEAFRKFLETHKPQGVVLVGVEAHICVAQTALDLLEAGFSVWIPYDGVLSRREEDLGCALDYLECAGARIVSSEMVIYQTLGQAGTEEFKKMLPRVV